MYSQQNKELIRFRQMPKNLVETNYLGLILRLNLDSYK